MDRCVKGTTNMMKTYRLLLTTLLVIALLGAIGTLVQGCGEDDVVVPHPQFRGDPGCTDCPPLALVSWDLRGCREVDGYFNEVRRLKDCCCFTRPEQAANSHGYVHVVARDTSGAPIEGIDIGGWSLTHNGCGEPLSWLRPDGPHEISDSTGVVIQKFHGYVSPCFRDNGVFEVEIRDFLARGVYETQRFVIEPPGPMDEPPDTTFLAVTM
jgi:hypothetical protein